MLWATPAVVCATVVILSMCVLVWIAVHGLCGALSFC